MTISVEGEFDDLSYRVIGVALEVHQVLGGVARIDLIVDQSLILELKAVDALHDVHLAQVRAYLSLTGFKLGLLMNFNSAKLVVRRVVLNRAALPAHS